MAGGSATQENPTDEQCPKCGLWYFGRGNALNMHKANCDGGDPDTDPDPPATSSTGPEATDDDVREAVEESEPENPALQGPDTGTDTDSSGKTCETCDGELLEPGDTFSHGGTEYEVDQGEYVCNPCGLVYSEGEV